jgi:hypothetical protein
MHFPIYVYLCVCEKQTLEKMKQEKFILTIVFYFTFTLGNNIACQMSLSSLCMNVCFSGSFKSVLKACSKAVSTRRYFLLLLSSFPNLSLLKLRVLMKSCLNF